MSTGKGIAIAGVWIGVGITSFPMGEVAAVVLLPMFLLALVATAWIVKS